MGRALRALRALLLLVQCWVGVAWAPTSGLGRLGWIERRAGFSRCSGLPTGTDYALESQTLARYLCSWIDAEYAEYPGGAELAEVVGSAYKRSRDTGMTDVVRVLEHIQWQLRTCNSTKAFVAQEWELLQKVEEGINMAVGVHSLPTPPTPPTPATSPTSYASPQSALAASAAKVDPRVFRDVSRRLTSAFERYKLLRGFLAGERVWAEVNILAAMLLGFRLQGFALKQCHDLAPLQWATLEQPIAFDHIDNLLLDDMMQRDLPADDKPVETVFDALVGVDDWLPMRLSTDPLVRRRLLLVKWMYTHGVFSSPFPPQTRPVSAGLEREDPLEE